MTDEYQNPESNQNLNPQQAAQPGQTAYRPSQMSGQQAYQAPAQQAYQQPAQQAYQQQAQSTYRQPAQPTYQQPAQPNYAAAGYRQAAPAQGGAHSAGAVAKQGGGWVKSLVAGAVGAVLASVITLAVAGMGGGSVSADQPGTAPAAGAGSGTNTTITVAGEDVSLPEAVAAKSLPSVVCIYVYQEMPAYGWFGQQSSGEQMSGLGSGVIISDDGYILTNYHVIEGESSLKVSVNNEQYDAQVVGTDSTSDLAVIKIDGAEGLTPIEIGSSADLVVGEWVMTVGAPYGMEQSVGSGIVSAVSRSSAALQDSDGAIYANMIQTDAPINPGNSGGALVDKEGKLVGINTLTASYSGSNSGVGFAIPVDYAYNIAQQIIAGEEPSHAQLGVSLVNVDSATAERYNLPVSEGAYVAAAYAGAAEAGIQEGDIITKVNGKKVTSATEVILQVRSCKVGDTVPVEVNRNGETKTMDVALTSDVDNANASSSQNAEGNQRQR